MGKFVENLKRYFEETPNDVLDRDWEVLKQFNDIGSDVVAYSERVMAAFSENGMRDYFMSSNTNQSYYSEDKYYMAA